MGRQHEIQKALCVLVSVGDIIMTRGTEWHNKMVGVKRDELRRDSLKVYDSEKMIGFKWPADIESQIKKVDVLAESENKVVIVEVEDAPKANDLKEGVAFVELGGIQLLSYIASKHTDKVVELCLILPSNVERHRFEKIRRIVNEAKNALTSLQITIEQRWLSEY